MQYRLVLHPCQLRALYCAHCMARIVWSNARESVSRAAHRRSVTSLDRRSTKNPRRGAPKSQGHPAQTTRSWSPGQALIDFDLW
jgi:hypothetical protein